MQVIENDLLDYVRSLRNHVNEMGNYWKGSDYNQFQKTMEPFLKEMDQYIESLKSYHEFMNGYLEAMRTLHEQYENKTIKLK